MKDENLNNQESANSDLGAVSGSFISENDFGKDVNGKMFVDELGNKREAKSITYDDAGVPYLKWKGYPPIGSKCAYNLRFNKRMKWL